MMKKKIMNLASKLLMMCLLMGISLIGSAQDNAPAMADTMRSNGKIYVVVAVCLTLLIGLFLYMIRVERMVRKLEKENKQILQK